MFWTTKKTTWRLTQLPMGHTGKQFSPSYFSSSEDAEEAVRSALKAIEALYDNRDVDGPFNMNKVNQGFGDFDITLTIGISPGTQMRWTIRSMS